ncbi:conserved hypothetical protein [Ricinus communis]|uniref:Sulfotransferase n=1 Tax=Ricinus communis TaxID=3988 RepID=B9RLJ7_RICCO|nr:conserved hypothetical protein [Ricinus communis]
MKKDATFHVKKLAEFMGYSFTLEEKENGAVQKIVNMSSFENLSNLEVNKHGHNENKSIDIENNIFFRKGKVGDWKSYLTPEMGTRLDEIMKLKLTGLGLTMMSPDLVTGDGSSSS